jgi:hypothetical protein
VTQAFRGALIGAVLIVSANLAAQQPAPAAQPPPPSQPAVPQTQAPPPAGQPQPAPPAQGQPPVGSAVSQLPVAPVPVSLGPNCPAPPPPATLPQRAFGGDTGMLLHQVIPTRVPDFEKVIAYLRDALAKTTNVTLRKQAAGWKMYRVAEPGPNGDVIYAFLLDPAVPCVDYALGPILADAITDAALLQEVWKLYQGSVRSGGTVMNLGPIPVVPPTPDLAPSTTPATPGQPSTQKPPASSVPAPLPGVPIDADPNRPPNQ